MSDAAIEKAFFQEGVKIDFVEKLLQYGCCLGVGHLSISNVFNDVQNELKFGFECLRLFFFCFSLDGWELFENEKDFSGI